MHKRAAGEVHALRRLALPSTVGLIETSGGQEDVQSFGWEAAESLRQAIRHGRAVTSCELLTAYRAVTLSPHLVPPGCRALMDSLTDVIGPIEGDRPFGEDIERLTAASWPPGPADQRNNERLRQVCSPRAQVRARGRSPTGNRGIEHEHGERHPERAARASAP